MLRTGQETRSNVQKDLVVSPRHGGRFDRYFTHPVDGEAVEKHSGTTELRNGGSGRVEERVRFTLAVDIVPREIDAPSNTVASVLAAGAIYVGTGNGGQFFVSSTASICCDRSESTERLEE